MVNIISCLEQAYFEGIPILNRKGVELLGLPEEHLGSSDQDLLEEFFLEPFSSFSAVSFIYKFAKLTYYNGCIIMCVIRTLFK